MQGASVLDKDSPWFPDFVYYLAGSIIPTKFSHQQKKKFFSYVKHYVWEDPFSYKICADQVVQRCVSHAEGLEILRHCHFGAVGGHFSAN